MKLRVGSREERAEILVLITKQLVKSECRDMDLLSNIDKLCRRTWGDLHPGWITWAYYLENLLGEENYREFARNNCSALAGRPGIEPG